MNRKFRTQCYKNSKYLKNNNLSKKKLIKKIRNRAVEGWTDIF